MDLPMLQSAKGSKKNSLEISLTLLRKDHTMNGLPKAKGTHVGPYT